MDNALCVGINIAAQAEQLQVDIRRRERPLARIAFRDSREGIEALTALMLGWSGPVRVAIAGTSAAAIELTMPGRDSMPSIPPDLRRYAMGDVTFLGLGLLGFGLLILYVKLAGRR